MSGRVSEAILQNTSWSVGRQAPMLDLKYGGQMGFSANLSQWVSNQSYVRRNLFCLLLEAPRGFALMPGGDILVSILRSLVELHPLSIDGLNATVEVDAQETAPVGGAGEQHQDFMNVTRQRSNPVFRWTEKYGMPINAFLETWITYLLQDPESKVANIATLDISPPSDMLADMYSATMIFIETDPTHKKVVKAWIGTNMWPTSGGEVLGRREITAPGEAVTYDITFTGIFQTGAGVRTFAQQLLDGISITGANPQNRPSFISAIAADVAAVTEGYSQGISTLANSSIRA